MLGRRTVRVCNIVITLLRIHNYILGFVNLVDGIVLSDLQRQQLGVDIGPEDALVFLALTHPFGHTSDTADVLSDLRDHFFRARGQLVGRAPLATPVFLPSAMMRLL
jgi:hypothetical protein